MIQKVLVACRGEIAVRVIRTCRSMGIKTVAAYSKCDKDTLAVFLADEAVCIGDVVAEASYLNADNIIQAAINCGCDAIHPGYGFLSEDALFAKKVRESGKVFLGPSNNAIKDASNKRMLKRKARKLGIPTIPDVNGEYPFMLKANFGGGGKGIHVIEDDNGYKKISSEIKEELYVGFTSCETFKEKIVDTYKHIDIQFLADADGNITIFPARDCSVQNNYQKVIEETPAVGVSEEIISAMMSDTVKIAKAIHYDNVGTAEFLVDKTGDYYFLEINARIQVEHTITEEVTGVDLVEQQIRLASGELNSFPENLEADGHSVECRVLAKTCGAMQIFNFPAGNGVRIDNYAYQGYEVKPFYDPLFMKIIISAENRERALSKMKLALDETIIYGIDTNVDELYDIVNSKDYQTGKYSIFGAAK